ncbi:hypothetical protein GCM10022234_00790 [Aeromicrobium panaciterrae]|uniref:hypothetical protein n=1 Tax=Aeromicrobium panaciterrae TaxID=363861 RepID=UPI0031E1E384
MNYFHFAIPTGSTRSPQSCAVHIERRFGIEGRPELVSIQPAYRLYRIGYHHTEKQLPLRH